MNLPYMYIHLLSRGFDPKKYKVFISERDLSATFLLYNLLGRIVGYQRYSPSFPKQGRDPRFMAYFTWASRNEHTIWGWEYLQKSADRLYLTEGIFDAVKILNAGHNAIALLGNAGSPAVRQYLRALPYTKIAICDNDEAGKTLAKSADLWYNTPAGFKDLGEMPQERVNEWLATLT